MGNYLCCIQIWTILIYKENEENLDSFSNWGSFYEEEKNKNSVCKYSFDCSTSNIVSEYDVLTLGFFSSTVNCLLVEIPLDEFNFLRYI